ncbi:NAD(P)-dependent dehydrogenase (short-subunit alcohol dehydrogenase family) [Algoriphagus iocasae]|jgi:NAD(P)-dependent dehydrogenase (short-subunit alcohol dehydrogenase family)|uniref:NAD(P)-dependent dehydrogenase (Short-subunit alcohol dehydrogenase family) n=1 Tax=Algoriphagus iocasae TaxID=1836499 RepID=A0A841MI12_9BACT|nr:SDR family oxidoreductase [Algoriphagus iocasae]MBB6326503.1 NAD(P)-dependent dehydrogenase (short-subunit alcohol dehydrogenase family) [Algoriphagus iocasae]
MQISLKGQRILVTGASRGIGRAIAKQLSESGAEVIIHFNSNEEEAKSLQNELSGVSYVEKCDLGNSDSVVGFIPKLVEKYGPLSGIVNNAGIAKSASDDLPTDKWLEIWNETIQVNSTSVGILCKEFVDHAKINNGGRIVTISSRAAFRGDTTDYLAYAASKGALVSLTRSIARHYGKVGIKAFLIAPGFTRTDMANEILSEYGEGFALNDIALNELTKPEDIAPMVTLLCSGFADHATGASIDINAGSYVH